MATWYVGIHATRTKSASRKTVIKMLHGPLDLTWLI